MDKIMEKLLSKIKDLKVEKKLKRCFRDIVLIASLSGMIAVVVLLYSNSAYSRALVKNGFSQGDIGAFNTALNEGAAMIRDFILIESNEQLVDLRERFDAKTEEVDAALQKIKEICTTDEEKKIIAEIEEKLPTYRDARLEVIQAGLANKNKEAWQKLDNDALPIMETISDKAQELVDLNKSMGEKVSTQLKIETYIATAVIILIIVLAIVASTNFATYIARMFSNPIINVKDVMARMAEGMLDVQAVKENDDEIGEMTESLNDAMATLRLYISELSKNLSEMARGNFNFTSDVHYKGEFQELGEAMEKIVDSLSSTLGQIGESSDQVALGSAQMAESAQSLAEGATDQAGAVEQLTATIQDVTEAVVGNAETADRSYQNAKEFGLQAQASNEDIQQLNEAMSRINDTSTKIADIISEIEDIASQTNLLSLNASIEAARAGEAGKGFAVVADQIGKLASDSATSAVNTRELIENSIHEIQKGNEITAKTTEAIGAVILGMQSLAESTKEISELSRTQAESMKQLEQGVEQISEVIQNNSAAAEQTSATSQELSAQSDNLKNLVEQFELKR